MLNHLVIKVYVWARRAWQSMIVGQVRSFRSSIIHRNTGFSSDMLHDSGDCSMRTVNNWDLTCNNFDLKG